jgi:hypothetical protein
MKRNYVVHYKRGRLPITVDSSVVELRGERTAVAQAAWFKLMGQNSLGEDVDKNLPTRQILRTEMLSRLEGYRGEVQDIFTRTINFTLISLGE